LLDSGAQVDSKSNVSAPLITAAPTRLFEARSAPCATYVFATCNTDSLKQY